MVAVGSSISASDYNTMRTTVSNVLNSQYNETLISSAVAGGTGNPSTSDSVEASHLLNLFLDIQKAYVHQQGAINTTIAVASAGYTIGADTSLSYNQTTGVKTTVTDSTKMGFNDLNAVVTLINDFNGSVTGWPVGNFTSGTPVQSSRGSVWGGAGQVQAIYHVLTIDFVNENEMNGYFSAGGEIRFVGELNSPGNSKSVDWQNLLSSMSTVKFNKYRTEASAGTANPSGSGYDSLTSSYRTLFTKVGSGAYSDNEYKIEARKVSTTQLRFRITFNDGDVGTSITSPIDETVIGTTVSRVSSFRADSSFVYNLTTYTAVERSDPTITTQVTLMTDNVTPPA